MKQLRMAIIFFGLFITAFASTTVAASKVRVFVSILPQQTFVEKIGGNYVDVRVMVKPGANPATYEPKPRQMAEISRAKLYFSIGVPFENAWLEKISSSNPKMKVIHTDEGIEKIEMAEHHHHDEDEGHEEHGHKDDHKEHEEHGHKDDHKEHDEHGDHEEHHGMDPHIWLSPTLVKIQAKHIVDALVAVDPAHKSAYKRNYNKFLDEIEKLRIDIANVFKGKDGKQFMVFHPSWGYLAHEYGLEQIGAEIEGKDPKPAQLQELIHHAKEEGIRVIFVQPQFSKRSAKLIAKEINGKVIEADPLALNWAENLRKVAKTFEEVLR